MSSRYKRQRFNRKLRRFSPGDRVRATKYGCQDLKGLPAVTPQPGQIYIITRVYPARYGIGCELFGLDPTPYLGFYLYVHEGWNDSALAGWYFEHIDDSVGLSDDLTEEKGANDGC